LNKRKKGTSTTATGKRACSSHNREGMQFLTFQSLSLPNAELRPIYSSSSFGRRLMGDTSTYRNALGSNSGVGVAPDDPDQNSIPFLLEGYNEPPSPDLLADSFFSIDTETKINRNASLASSTGEMEGYSNKKREAEELSARSSATSGDYGLRSSSSLDISRAVLRSKPGGHESKYFSLRIAEVLRTKKREKASLVKRRKIRKN